MTIRVIASNLFSSTIDTNTKCLNDSHPEENILLLMRIQLQVFWVSGRERERFRSAPVAAAENSEDAALLKSRVESSSSSQRKRQSSAGGDSEGRN